MGLDKVSMGRFCCAQFTNIDNYRSLLGDGVIDEVVELAKELRDVRICQVNSTPFGGGVAEILSQYVPLLQALGVQADWRIIHGDKRFFSVTKDFHNALQGAEFKLKDSVKRIYNQYNKHGAYLLEDEYDVYVVHDPQPAAIKHFYTGNGKKWIWRCHIDSSMPNPEVWSFLKPYVEEYDAVIFTMAQFVPPDLHHDRIALIPPAIDPLSTKNMDIPEAIYKAVMANQGVDLRRPLLVQVSRFDPWKDPMGVIQAYRLVKEKMPEVQLALIGAMAGDDPEGWKMLSEINHEAAKDVDLYVFTNLSGVGNMEVNAFQRGCTLVIQKSLREGFGLVVAEALWKGTAVVAGEVGGIPMQMPEGFSNFLVEDVEECAEKSLYLLEHEDVRRKFGEAGRENVRRNFLIPRIVRDDLALIKSIL